MKNLMTLIITLFAVAMISVPAQAKSKIEIPEQKTAQFRQSFEDGYLMMTGRKSSLGELLYSTCRKVDYAVARCEFQYLVSEQASYLTVFNLEVSLLDGIIGEQIYSVVHTSPLR